MIIITLTALRCILVNDRPKNIEFSVFDVRKPVGDGEKNYVHVFSATAAMAGPDGNKTCGIIIPSYAIKSYAEIKCNAAAFASHYGAV